MTELTEEIKNVETDTIILGDALTQWKEHERICCLTSDLFIKHLLKIHQQFCKSYLEANGEKCIQENGLECKQDIATEKHKEAHDVSTQYENQFPTKDSLAIGNKSLHSSEEPSQYQQGTQRRLPDTNAMEDGDTGSQAIVEIDRAQSDDAIVVPIGVKNETDADGGIAIEERSSEDLNSLTIGDVHSLAGARQPKNIQKPTNSNSNSPQKQMDQRSFLSSVHLALAGATPVQPNANTSFPTNTITPNRGPFRNIMDHSAFQMPIPGASAIQMSQPGASAIQMSLSDTSAVQMSHQQPNTIPISQAGTNPGHLSQPGTPLGNLSQQLLPQNSAKSKGNYCKYSVQFKRTVCQYAKMHDIQAAQQHFSRIAPQLKSKTIFYWLSVMKLDPPNASSSSAAPVIPVYTRYSARFKHQVCEYALEHSLREAVKMYGSKAPKLCDTLINYWMKKHDRNKVFSPEDKEENEMPSIKVPEEQSAGTRFNYTDQLKYEVAAYARVFSIQDAITNFGLGGVELDVKTVKKWIAERRDEPLPQPDDEVDDSMIDENGIDPEAGRGIYQGPHVTYSGKRRPNYSHELMLDVSAYALKYSIHGALNAFKTVTPMLSRASIRKFMQKNRQQIEHHIRTIHYAPSPVKYLQPEEFKLRSQYIEIDEQNSSWTDTQPPANQQWYQDDGDDEDQPIVIPLNGDGNGEGNGDGNGEGDGNGDGMVDKNDIGNENEAGDHVIGIEPIGIEPIEEYASADDSTSNQGGDYTAFKVDQADTSPISKRKSQVAKKSTGGVINKDLIYPPDFRQKVCNYVQHHGINLALDKFKALSPSLTLELVKSWMHKLDDHIDETEAQTVPIKRQRIEASGSRSSSPGSKSSIGPKFAIDGEDYSHLPQHVCEHAKLNGIQSAVNLYKPVIPDLNESLIQEWITAMEQKQKEDEDQKAVQNDADLDGINEPDALGRFKNMVCAYARNEGVEQAAIRFSRSDTNAVLAPETISSWLREGYGANTSLSDKNINPVLAQAESTAESPSSNERRRCARYSNEFKRTVCNYARETSPNVAWKFFKQVEPDLSIQIVSYWLKKGI